MVKLEEVNNIMSKYNPKSKAKEIVDKVSDILDTSGIYPDLMLRNKAIFNICLLYLNELRDATYGGYDYDAEFELPYYDAIEIEIKNLLKLIE
jgi:hypothetical protein